MSDNRARLEQGGITLQADDTTYPLTAATFTHPVLPGRTIVRLIPEPLLEAERLALEVPGVELQGSTPVGHTRRRGVGFPAWPILNDPDNAEHALNLVGDLERATRRARPKPGATKREILELTASLENSAPHFLPTFLEQAARVYLRVGNHAHAAHMFGRAREAERRYALPINEERHRDVLMEFAYAGAINAKALSAEAQSLSERLEPADAYETFRALCVERIRGGLTPYSGMKKDLAKLAKAAGLKPADEEVRIVSELLRIGSIERANESFWKSYNAAIRKAAAKDEQLRAILLTLTPKEANNDNWLELLDASGALELVKQGTHPEFVPLIVSFASKRRWGRWGSPEPSKKLAPVLADILPHAGCTRVTLSRRTINEMPAAVLEQLAAHDVAVEVDDAGPETFVDMKAWVDSEDRAPLPHLAAHEDLRKYLINGIKRELTSPDVVSIVSTDPDLRPVMIEMLTEQVELLESAPPTADRLTEVTSFVRHFEFIADAEVQALLDRVRTYHSDLAEVLAETLRRGLLDELGWPEFEEAYKNNTAGNGRHGARLQECWPGVVAYNDSKATYVCGRTSHDIQNWTGASIGGVTEVEGQFAIQHFDPSASKNYVNWSSSGERLVARTRQSWFHDPDESIPVPGGRLVDANTIIRPDRSTWSDGSKQFFNEGDRFWMVQDNRKTVKVVEIDPKTGAKGRESLPDWFEEQRRRHPDLVFDPTRSQLRPVTDETTGSLFSTADGYHRSAVFYRPDDPHVQLVIDADGTEYHVTGTYAPLVRGVIRLPDGQPRVLAGNGRTIYLLDPDDLMPTVHHGIGFETPLWWHHAVPRDPELSARLRQITAEELRPLIERISAPGLPITVFHEAVSTLLGLPSSTVHDAVVDHAFALVRSWPDWATSAPTPALLDAPTLKHHLRVLTSAMHTHLTKFDVMSIWRDTATLGLHDRELPKHAQKDRLPSLRHSWGDLLGNTDALLALAAIPGRTAGEIRALKELWSVLRESGLVGADNLFVDVLQIPDGVDPFLHVAPPRTLEIDHGIDTITLLRADSGKPVARRGRTFTLLERREIAPGHTDLEPVFDALMERVRANGPQPWSPEPGESFAAASGVSVTDAHLIMAGFPNFADFEDNYLPKELRTALGLKVQEALDTKRRLQEVNEHFLAVLAAGVPKDPAELLEHGLDTQAMAARWPGHPPAPEQLHADTSAREKPAATLADRRPTSLWDTTFRDVIAGKHDKRFWGDEVAMLLWIANEVGPSDPLRPALADYAEELAQSPAGLGSVHLGRIRDHAQVRQRLGLPGPEEASIGSQQQPAGRFRIESNRWQDSLHADLSDITDPDDPDLNVARQWGVAFGGDVQTLAALDVWLSGGLSAYAQWLREHGEGDPHDPLVVVPELVADVAAELGVSEDVARYYLQLLAWPDPTDANVRRWNNWKKADITRAGKQLAALDLVIEAKRTRSGRSFFLPGGWLEAAPPHVPLEMWKKEAFGMVVLPDFTKPRPMLGVAVASLPPTLWFPACWERSRGDDAPQFADLETTRSRRR